MKLLIGCFNDISLEHRSSCQLCMFGIFLPPSVNIQYWCIFPEHWDCNAYLCILHSEKRYQQHSWHLRNHHFEESILDHTQDIGAYLHCICGKQEAILSKYLGIDCSLICRLSINYWYLSANRNQKKYFEWSQSWKSKGLSQKVECYPVLFFLRPK